MLQVTLDLSELREYALQSEDPLVHLAAARATQRVAEYVQQTWESVAEGTILPGMARGFVDPAYAASIRTVVSPTHVDVMTDYTGAMRIQHGRPPVDLKPGLLNGPHAKIARDGHRYNTIPFKAHTPNGAPVSPQRPLQPLPNDVYRAALQGKRISPESEMGQRYQRENWQVGPYAGLRREVAPGARRGTYHTYRTVSAHSDPASWVIPSLPPLDVRGAVADYVRPMVQEIILEELARL